MFAFTHFVIISSVLMITYQNSYCVYIFKKHQLLSLEYQYQAISSENIVISVCFTLPYTQPAILSSLYSFSFTSFATVYCRGEKKTLSLHFTLITDVFNKSACGLLNVALIYNLLLKSLCRKYWDMIFFLHRHALPPGINRKKLWLFILIYWCTINMNRIFWKC